MTPSNEDFEHTTSNSAEMLPRHVFMGAYFYGSC